MSAPGRGLYFLRRALDAMARGRRVTLVATSTIFVAALVTGLFAAMLQLGGRLVGAWAGEVQISVYLQPNADLEVARAAAAEIAPRRAVEAVPSEEALRRFKVALADQAALAEGLGADVIPPSIEIRAPGIGLADARALAARLRSIPGAREVDYGNAWVERLERLLRTLRWVGALLLAALAAGAAVLVSNTLRLGVLARRDEIEIMKLVGATDLFVRLPFLLEGLIEGAAGAALAAGLLCAAAGAGAPRLGGVLGWGPLSRADLVPAALVAMLVAGGAVLGLLSSFLAVGRELRT